MNALRQRNDLRPVIEAEANARGVLIGASNRSVPGLNNVLRLAPALVATAAEIDEITSAIDGALSAVFG